MGLSIGERRIERDTEEIDRDYCDGNTTQSTEKGRQDARVGERVG